MRRRESREAITAATDSDVRVDARVAGCPCKVLVLPIRNMLMAPGISVFLREAKINDVHHVLPLSEPNLSQNSTRT